MSTQTDNRVRPVYVFCSQGERPGPDEKNTTLINCVGVDRECRYNGLLECFEVHNIGDEKMFTLYPNLLLVREGALDNHETLMDAINSSTNEQFQPFKDADHFCGKECDHDE